MYPGLCNYGIYRLAVSLCYIIPTTFGSNAVGSSSIVHMSKNRKIRNRYRSHVPKHVPTVPLTVAESQETTSLGFTQKSGDARPYTVGTKQNYRAYCCVWVEGCGVVKRAEKKETGNSDTSQWSYRIKQCWAQQSTYKKVWSRWAFEQCLFIFVINFRYMLCNLVQFTRI
jgi:hypothetical protein